MSKARRQLNKNGKKNRLVKGSLVLSFTRFASSRVVRFFESGLASHLLKSADKVDQFAKEKISTPIFKKIELRKNFTVPMRNRFTSFLSTNTLYIRGNRLIQSLINTSLRSIGVFLLTFSIYSIAAFLIRRYITTALGEADITNLCVSAITLISGLLLTLFGEKSVLNALCSGKITGSLLSESLGVNDSVFDRLSKTPPKLSLGMSFLIGSIFGLLTLFVAPSKVLLALLSLGILIGVFNVPEFGLLLGAAMVSFASKEFIAGIALATVVSHFFKWLRLKRNLRFGSADVVMVIFTLMMFITNLASGQRVNGGEFDLLIFVLIYFAVKNLVYTQRLLSQCFSALRSGLFLGMALYILDQFKMYITFGQFRQAASYMTANIVETDILAMLIAAVVPLSLVSPLFLKDKKGFWFIVLAIISLVITDSPFFYFVLFSSIFVFIIFTYKAPIGGFIGALTIMTPVLFVVYNTSNSAEVSALVYKAFDGVLETQFFAKNFWEGLNLLSGPLVVFVFAVGVVILMQQIVSVICFAKNNSLSKVGGAISSSAVMTLVSMTLFNSFSDVRSVAFIFFILGLCGAVFKLYVVSEKNHIDASEKIVEVDCDGNPKEV